MMKAGKHTVAIVEFKHETHTFCSYKTTIEDFRSRYLLYGDEILNVLGGTKTEMAGFIDACQEAGFDILPVIAANATPGGIVSQKAFDEISDYIFTTLQNNIGRFDAVLFSMHGAMVTEKDLDGDGELLSSLKKIVGTEIPVFATLDLHANLSQRMLDNADALFPYETYPHTDQYAKAYEAGKRMAERLRGELSPLMRACHIPIMTSVLETAKEPLLSMQADIAKLKSDNNDLIVASLLHGFSWADTPDTGCAVVVVTNNNEPLAQQTLDHIKWQILSRKEEFEIKELYSINEAIKFIEAVSDGPIVFADLSDNPGGGGPADSTHILKALIDNRVRNAAFAIIVDPASVNKAIDAGVGNIVEVDLGGKAEDPYINGYPVHVRAAVKTIADGIYVNKGKMAKGVINDLGRSVVLDIDGIEVIVTEKRLQPWDLEVYRRMGIEPSEKKLLVVKSSMHFRASFGAIAKSIINIDCPGLLSSNFKNFTYKHLQRPIFPLDR
ncbi:M81 family metallopeptidase [Cloacibacillus sp. An23]|uniref:M81 family metallopeptidase n=1 Tax=Cloacibacillus sp. An23 TaxID=1965591 RepID=UPI001302819F|nr:M81 family metallopeptidase [Cloacibacillus sp. An23]